MKLLTVTVLTFMMLSCSFGQSCIAQTNPNRIINGNFQNPNVGSYNFLFSVPGWTGSGFIQIGKGNIYNSRWGSYQVVELDTNQNNPIRQNVELEESLVCVIKFQYAARVASPLQSSKIKVYWNDELIAELAPSDYQIKFETFQVSGRKGTNSLVFAAAGISDGYGATIRGIELTYKQASSSCSLDTSRFIPELEAQCNAAVSSGDFESLKQFYRQSVKETLLTFLYEKVPVVEVPKTEYVVNGGFEDPKFTQQYTFFSSIPGWTGAIELGQGKVYNSDWPENNVVAQLDVSGNTALSQTINLSEAKAYALTFKYAQRAMRKNSSDMKVYWDGVQVANIVAATPLVQTFTIDIEGTIGAHQLKLEGSGTSDSYGITIDDVSLKAK